jgi:hypothetical protein
MQSLKIYSMQLIWNMITLKYLQFSSCNAAQFTGQIIMICVEACMSFDWPAVTNIDSGGMWPSLRTIVIL